MEIMKKKIILSFFAGMVTLCLLGALQTSNQFTIVGSSSVTNRFLVGAGGSAHGAYRYGSSDRWSSEVNSNVYNVAINAAGGTVLAVDQANEKIDILYSLIPSTLSVDLGTISVPFQEIYGGSGNFSGTVTLNGGSVFGGGNHNFGDQSLSYTGSGSSQVTGWGGDGIFEFGILGLRVLCSQTNLANRIVLQTNIVGEVFNFQTTTSGAQTAATIATANSSAWNIFVNVAAAENDFSEAGGYFRTYTVRNVAGTTTVVGAVRTIGTDNETTAGWDVTVTEVDPNIIIQVTGENAKTINWSILIQAVRVQ